MPLHSLRVKLAELTELTPAIVELAPAEAALAPAVVYPAGSSTGVTIERAALRTVVVTAEALEKTIVVPGESLSYYATVWDNQVPPAAIPTAFAARLMLSTTLLVSFSFTAAVYNPVTGALALAFTFPDVAVGTYNVHLEWDKQTI